MISLEERIIQIQQEKRNRKIQRIKNVMQFMFESSIVSIMTLVVFIFMFCQI